MSDIPIKVGNKIPLRAQETAGRTDKVIRCNLYDDPDFVTPIAPEVTLPHVGGGLYFDDSVTMPDADRIWAQYKVFDADGVTPNTEGQQCALDVFAKDSLAVDLAGILADTIREPDAVATVDETEFVAVVDEDFAYIATLEDDDSIATVESDEALTGTIEETEFIAITED